MPDISLRFNKDMLVAAPLFTAELVGIQEDVAECLEFLNILDDELVKETYQRFKLSGAQCAMTNTLRANRQVLATFGLENALEDINRAAIRIAREMEFEHIIAALECAPLEVMLEQAEVLLTEEPDALLLVPSKDAEGGFATQVHPTITEVLAELRAQTSLPIIAPEEGDVLYCADLSEAETLQWLKDARDTATKPLMVCPRVSIKTPQNKRQESQEISRACDALVEFALAARNEGAQIIGTAPGSMPAFTGAIYAAIGGMDAL